MARKKVTLAYIANDAERRASFRKRKKGVIKKVKEISTLCDVDACAIIYGENETEPEVWPSVEGALAVLARYYGLPEHERARKMVNHDGFTRMRSMKMRGQIYRLRKENRRAEAEKFVYQCRAGTASLENFDMGYKTEMAWVIDQILRDLTSNMDALKMDRGGASSSGTAAGAAAGAAAATGAAAAAGAARAAAEGAAAAEKESAEKGRAMQVASPPVEQATWDSLMRDMQNSMMPGTSWFGWNDFDAPSPGPEA